MSRLRGEHVQKPDDVAEGSVVTVFRVAPDQDGMRLDRFLHAELRRTSRTRTQDIIRNSAYDEFGKHLKPNSRVHPDIRVVLWRAPWDEEEVASEIPEIYEDEHLLAVNKPAGMPVHPSARYHKNTLIKKLQAARPGQWISLGHRLDRETSGIILLPKTIECDRALKRKLEARDDIEKVYIALTWGVPDGAQAKRFRCDLKMMLDPYSALSVKMVVNDGSDAMTAATAFELDGTRTNQEGAVYSRVRCTLETGRQHQIRLHLAALGAPIVGDKLYGPDELLFARGADGELTDEDRVQLELPRHALHAAELRFAHPITGERLNLVTDLPEDLATFWDGLQPPA